MTNNTSVRLLAIGYTLKVAVLNFNFNFNLSLMTDHRKILIVAYSGQGHINPAFRFATRLLKKGVSVTFCTSLSVIQSIDKETIPHGLTLAPFSDGHDKGKQPNTSILQYVSDFETNGRAAVAEFITSATVAGHPFDHLIYTTVIPWVARVGHAHNVKSSLLWCQSATVLSIYYYYVNEYQGLISSNNNKPTFPIDLPGLPPLTVADLPSFLMSSSPKELEFLVSVFIDHIVALEISPKILINTFDELEFKSLRAVKKLDFLPIGPLVPSDNDFFERKDESYIQWLHTKSKSSVVYVSFGTKATFSMDQLEEMSMGLLEIRRPFLWVIRDSEQIGRLSKIDELKKHGMVVSWCSQMEVLRHQAVGCFVMHCGWNSTLESLVTGIPVVAFPQWSDQGNDAMMIEDVWKTGVRVKRRETDGVVEGKEIKRCVELVMGDEEIKRNVEKWKELAKEPLKNGGSCEVNLQAFLDYV